MKKLDVCMSPELIHLYELEGRTVVIVDILRATSCMTAGIASGIQSIQPFDDKDKCLAMRPKGYVLAGERNGEKIAAFDIGNSPFQYMQPELKGKKVAVTTTNGTRAIETSKKADKIIIGSFLNISAVVNALQEDENDLLVYCAGWKGKLNLEDSLFAGALIERLGDNYESACDAPLIAKAIYKEGKKDMFAFLSNSSHVNRLKRLGIEKDIAFCLKEDEFDVVPYLHQGNIIA